MIFVDIQKGFLYTSVIKKGLLVQFYFKPRFCSRYRSEAQKTVAKRAVGAILRRRHIHRYVEEQNRETSVAARIFKPQ